MSLDIILADLREIQAIHARGHAAQDMRDWERDVADFSTARTRLVALLANNEIENFPAIHLKAKNLYEDTLFHLTKGIRREVMLNFKLCPSIRSTDDAVARITTALDAANTLMARHQQLPNKYRELIRFIEELNFAKANPKIDSAQLKRATSIASPEMVRTSPKKKAKKPSPTIAEKSSSSSSSLNPAQYESAGDRLFDRGDRATNPLERTALLKAAIQNYEHALLHSLMDYQTKARVGRFWTGQLLDEALDLAKGHFQMKSSIRYARELIIEAHRAMPAPDEKAIQDQVTIQLGHIEARLNHYLFLRKRFMVDHGKKYGLKVNVGHLTVDTFCDHLQQDSRRLRDHSFLRQHFYNSLSELRRADGASRAGFIALAMKYATQIIEMINPPGTVEQKEIRDMNALDQTPKIQEGAGGEAPQGWDPRLFLNNTYARDYSVSPHVTHRQLRDSRDNETPAPTDQSVPDSASDSDTCSIQ